jgi:hypothetical protein
MTHCATNGIVAAASVAGQPFLSREMSSSWCLMAVEGQATASVQSNEAQNGRFLKTRGVAKPPTQRESSSGWLCPMR